LNQEVVCVIDANSRAIALNATPGGDMTVDDFRGRLKSCLKCDIPLLVGAVSSKRAT